MTTRISSYRTFAAVQRTSSAPYGNWWRWSLSLAVLNFFSLCRLQICRGLSCFRSSVSRVDAQWQMMTLRHSAMMRSHRCFATTPSWRLDTLTIGWRHSLRMFLLVRPHSVLSGTTSTGSSFRCVAVHMHTACFGLLMIRTCRKVRRRKSSSISGPKFPASYRLLKIHSMLQFLWYLCDNNVLIMHKKTKNFGAKPNVSPPGVLSPTGGKLRKVKFLRYQRPVARNQMH